MTDCIHNPLIAEDKTPYGGIKAGETLRVSFGIFRHYDIRKAFVVINKDDCDEVKYPMRWSGLANGYDRFSGEVQIIEAGLYFYAFEVHSPAGIFRIGAGDDSHARWLSGRKWDFVARDSKYRPPSRIKDGIIYQIMVDRFCIGGEIIKAKPYARYHDNWYDMPDYKPSAGGKVLNDDFFGGNLKGVTLKLDYLKSLNVRVIYLNPIFEAFSNHKYDTGNYLKIDPAFGTDEDFDELIAEAKARGMSVILDGVFSHTGADSVYFDKYRHYGGTGAYHSPDSPYFSWYRFRRYPDDYECWWDFDTLPNVNETEPSYDEFINGKNGVIQKWLKRGAAGFRLDVADELPDEFLDNLTFRAKKTKRTAFILGEVWENAATKYAYGLRRQYLWGGQLDSVMNYPFLSGVKEFILSRDATGLCNTVSSIVTSYPKEVSDLLMNMLGTHDTERIITALADSEAALRTRDDCAAKSIPPREHDAAIRRVRLAAVLQYTLPGVPGVFYGDEAGLEGYRDPFCRRAYPWGLEKIGLPEFFARLGKVRRIKAIKDGMFRPIFVGRGVFAFERYCGDKSVTIAVNAGDEPFKLNIDGALTDAISGKKFVAEAEISPLCALILK